MTNPFLRKLSSVTELPIPDVDLLEKLTCNQANVPARSEIAGEGDSPKYVHLLMEGLACRSKYQPDGKRQIVSYIVPGDLCDPHVRLLGHLDHSITTLSVCSIVRLTANQMDEIMSRPALAQAMYWSTLVEESILREWIVNVGARSAKERVAHLFCELYVRLRAVGLTHDHSFKLPLTQGELAETVGLSPVHVNRALQALRHAGLIKLDQRELEITDPAGLVRAAGFNIDYLHFGENERLTAKTELDAGPEGRSIVKLDR